MCNSILESSTKSRAYCRLPARIAQMYTDTKSSGAFSFSNHALSTLRFTDSYWVAGWCSHLVETTRCNASYTHGKPSRYHLDNDEPGACRELNKQSFLPQSF